MEEVYVLINTTDFDNVVGVYSTLDRAISEGRKYYEDNIFDNLKMVVAPDEWEDNCWLLFSGEGEGKYKRTPCGYIQRYEVKK